MDVRKLRAAQTQAERLGLDAGPNALGAPLEAAAALDELVQSGSLALEPRYTTEIAATAAVAAARSGTHVTQSAVQATQRPSTVIDPGVDARAIGAPPLAPLATNDPRMLWVILGGLLVFALIMRARR